MITLLFLQFNHFKKLWNVSDIICLNSNLTSCFYCSYFLFYPFFPFMTSLSECKSSLSSYEAAKITHSVFTSCFSALTIFIFFCFNVWFINRNWFPLENICDSRFVHQRHLQSVPLLSPQISRFWQASHVWRTAAFFFFFLCVFWTCTCAVELTTHFNSDRKSRPSVCLTSLLLAVNHVEPVKSRNMLIYVHEVTYFMWWAEPP